MDSGTLILILLFGIVSLSHAAFLKFAEKQRRISKNTERLWQIHSSVNGPLWLLIFFGTAVLQFTLVPTIIYPSIVKILGVELVFTGIIIVVDVFSLLGFEQAMGMRFFFPERTKRIVSGVYRYFSNPMYDGFLFVLFGLGFSLGIKQDFYLALASFVFLNILLARIENYEHRLGPF
jgi:protein-S-isoprenylcysteine O-methyltransferase Ste14